MVNNSIDEVVQNLSNKAIEYAKSFGKVFNYSEDDIKELEEILDYYSKDLKGNLFKNLIRKINKTIPTENQIQSMALIWGSYLGQVLKKHVNIEMKWVKEDVFGDGEIIHLKAGDKRIFPIDKVYKRLVNGKEDNIVSFYEIVKKYLI